MSKENISLTVIEFWDWFERNEYMFREIVDQEHAVNELNEQVLSFGLFAWEIGSGTQKPFYFTISPNGDKNRLELSKKIIGAAPDLSQWEFHFCKQPKNDWDFTFEAYDRFYAKHTFNAVDWEYVLNKNEDQAVEIILRTDNLHIMDFDDELDAVDLVITNILGEELVIHHLEAFETVDEFGDEHILPPQKIPSLKLDFEKLLKEL